MSILSGKKVLLGISAGIAAYKTVALVRLLIKQGADVKVIMTPSAKEFVTPLTLATISKHPVLSEFVNNDEENPTWNNHVELGIWADVLLIAPATANTIAKMTSGQCDNLLLATYLSAKCPTYIAPAMDLDMYQHLSTTSNLEKLSTNGVTIIPAEEGELASGLVGFGRMAEPEHIVNYLADHMMHVAPWFGKKVLITAGPTHEPIDPVRFIGNHSTGTMGYCLAEVAAQLGAEVILISGPTHLVANHPNIKTIRVTTAEEMMAQVKNFYKKVDIAICSAAVSDYKPEEVSDIKLKKNDKPLELVLVRNPDILAWCGEQKKKQYLVGFALETHNALTYAKAKLQNKNCDLLVLNSLKDIGAGFGTTTNQVTLIDKHLSTFPLELKDKSIVAREICEFIINQ